MEIEPLDDRHPAWLLQENFKFLGPLSGTETAGFGEIHKVRERSWGELYALKIVRPDISDPEQKEQATRMLVREEQLHRELRHQHIVKLVADGTDGEHVLPYLLMEYIPGPCLEDYLTEGCGPLTRLRLALGVASGALYMHENQWLHNDLHPKNVVVDRNAEWPLLIDFGLATRFDEMEPSLLGFGRKGWTHPSVGEKEPFSLTTECFQLGKIVAYTVGDELDRLVHDATAREELHAVLTAMLAGESEDSRGLFDAIQRCLLAELTYQEI